MSHQPLQFYQALIDVASDPNKVYHGLKSGKQVTQLLGISPETYAQLYSKASTLFQQGSYNDALHAFYLLTFLDQGNFDIWIGLGMSLQMCKRYEAATIAYELAASHELDHPAPYFYLAKCLFAMHDHDASLQALELAIEFSKGKDEYTSLFEQACAAKSSLIRRQ